jgi:hypothetical protein
MAFDGSVILEVTELLVFGTSIAFKTQISSIPNLIYFVLFRASKAITF